MYSGLVLLAALLPGWSGASSVDDPAEQVLAFAGNIVVLPCIFSIPASGKFQTVEWSKQGLQPNIVFLQRGGYEIHAEQHPEFLYRTSIVPKELKNGNYSLRISNVQLSDAGTYRCMRLWGDGPRHVTSVELVVANVSVSEPKLSVTSAEGGAVTLQCEADCWLPEPHINFLDKQGKYIQAEKPKRDKDDRGCFTVTRRVTLQDAAAAANRVTCRVHQPETNQTMETEIIIPVVGGRTCFLTSAIAVGVTVLLCGLAVCLWKTWGKCAEGEKLPVSRQSSDQSTVSGSSENKSLLNCVTGEKATIKDLRAKLREQENTILQLQSQNQSHLSPVVCQHGQPVLLQPDRPVVLQHGQPVVLQPDRPVLLQHGRPVVLQHGQPVVLQHGQPVLLQHDRPVLLQHDRPVLLQPDRPLVLQPDRPVVLQPDRPVVLQPDRPVVLQPDRPVVLQPDRPVVLQHDRPVGLHGPAGFADSSPPKSVDIQQKKTPKPGFMRQSSVPSPIPPVYRFRRNHSSPDILKFLSSSSAVSASKKKLSSIGRSKSETYEPPLLFPKPQRRHSSVFPASNNRFKLLADLTEEPN